MRSLVARRRVAWKPMKHLRKRERELKLEREKLESRGKRDVQFRFGPTSVQFGLLEFTYILSTLFFSSFDLSALLFTSLHPQASASFKLEKDVGREQKRGRKFILGDIGLLAQTY